MYPDCGGRVSLHVGAQTMQASAPNGVGGGVNIHELKRGREPDRRNVGVRLDPAKRRDGYFRQARARTGEQLDVERSQTMLGPSPGEERHP
jgi:hypothetical protein